MCSKIKVRTTDFKIQLYSLYSPIYIDFYLLWSRPYIHLSFGQSNKIPPPVGHPHHWPNPKLSLPRRGHGPGVERSSHENRTCSFKTMGCNTNGWRTRICYTSSNDIIIFVSFCTIDQKKELAKDQSFFWCTNGRSWPPWNFKCLTDFLTVFSHSPFHCEVFSWAPKRNGKVLSCSSWSCWGIEIRNFPINSTYDYLQRAMSHQVSRKG